MIMKKYFEYILAPSNSVLFKFNIYIFTLLLFYSSNIYTQNLSAEQIYKKVSDAVVVIHAYDYNNNLSKQGSGVVLNDKGYVVTNYHVLEGCERLEILHKKKIIPYVDIIGIDVEKDILILKIDRKKFSSIKIGNSKNLNIGQRVYAIGSPLGFENTISEGIISGLRNYDETGKSFIQITASISAGSSGGAIVNDKGELIGISTFTAKEGQNLNFAIPIGDVLSVKISSYSENNAYKDFEWFSKGEDAYEMGDYQESVIYYTNFIKAYPNDAAAYNNRGVSKNKLKDFSGSIEDFTKAIEIDINDETAYNNRGGSKDELGDLKGAIKDFNKAIEINPNYANAYYNRGNVKYKLEDNTGALQDYNMAIGIDPNDADIFYNRGITKSRSGDYKGAIQDFSTATEIDPYFTAAYINRGIIKSNLDDQIGAMQDFNKAIEINPNSPEAYSMRGSAKAELSDHTGALKDFNKAIEINPNYAEAYYNRGIEKYNLGDKSGACLDWSKAGELGNVSVYTLIKIYCN